MSPNVVDKNHNQFLIGSIFSLQDSDNSEEGFLILFLGFCNVLANVHTARWLIMRASMQVSLIIGNANFISELAVSF
jgi:hypothetical protein